jgi:hypothetical protein
MIGVINVLLVNVSILVRATKLSVKFGNVKVPLLLMVEIIGFINVLFVNVYVAVLVTIVSEISGNIRTLFDDVLI